MAEEPIAVLVPGVGEDRPPIKEQADAPQHRKIIAIKQRCLEKLGMTVAGSLPSQILPVE
jgi:hypothetical protein